LSRYTASPWIVQVVVGNIADDGFNRALVGISVFRPLNPPTAADVKRSPIGRLDDARDQRLRSLTLGAAVGVVKVVGGLVFGLGLVFRRVQMPQGRVMCGVEVHGVGFQGAMAGSIR
jgi:hypothetical protein